MMDTRILCPACGHRYLVYHKADETPFWRCDGCISAFLGATLQFAIRSSGITIESVNYPHSLHFTDKGVTLR